MAESFPGPSWESAVLAKFAKRVPLAARCQCGTGGQAVRVAPKLYQYESAMSVDKSQ